MGLAIAALAATAQARWEGPSDNKADTELAELDLKALFNEGFDVCVRRAALRSGVREGEAEDPAITAAGDYLSVLEGFARDKNDGKLPDWMRALSFATTTKDCQRVFRAFVGGEIPDTKPAKPRPAARPARAKPKPLATETPVEPEPQPTVRRLPTPIASPTVRRMPTPVPTRPRPTAALEVPAPQPTQRQVKSPAAKRPRKSDEITEDLPPWLRPKEH
jgi:hypothetical protein